MRVVGARRTPRGDEPCETWPLARLDELCARADALVLALPLTDDTRHLFDARRLARVKRGAWLVNVGRGALVEEPALVEALREGRLGGAGLDVFRAAAAGEPAVDPPERPRDAAQLRRRPGQPRPRDGDLPRQSGALRAGRAAAQRSPPTMSPSRFVRAALLAAVVLAAPAVAPAQGGLPTREVAIGGERFLLEVAADAAAQFRGLGGRTVIPRNGGMLFVQASPRPLSFVMRDCPIPIDVAFLDADGRVLNVHTMSPEPPRRDGESTAAYEGRLPGHPSAGPAQYAIELAGGRFAELGVKPGDRIELEAPRASPAR
jgi:uncharacterized membrane protein (UPF0127 family)